MLIFLFHLFFSPLALRFPFAFPALPAAGAYAAALTSSSFVSSDTSSVDVTPWSSIVPPGAITSVDDLVAVLAAGPSSTRVDVYLTSVGLKSRRVEGVRVVCSCDRNGGEAGCLNVISYLMFHGRFLFKKIYPPPTPLRQGA